jgi:hypothetical protein
MINPEIESYNSQVKVFNLKLEEIKKKESDSIQLNLEGKLSKSQLKKIKIQTYNAISELNNSRPILPKSLQKKTNTNLENLLTLMALFHKKI